MWKNQFCFSFFVCGQFLCPPTDNQSNGLNSQTHGHIVETRHVFIRNLIEGVENKAICMTVRHTESVTVIINYAKVSFAVQLVSQQVIRSQNSRTTSASRLQPVITELLQNSL